jgi:hypothetical protein
MRFIESILVFVDPNDPDITQKLQSASRHRLKRRLAKSHT